MNGNSQYIEQVKLQGGPKVEFLLKNGLNENSSPQDWFTSFLPVYDGSTCNPNTVNSPCWTHRWALFTNMKAMLLGPGVPGGVYPNFKLFSCQEIECFIGLYVIQGLNPSPRIEMKFSSQQTDPLQGSDLCFHAFWGRCYSLPQAIQGNFYNPKLTKPTTRKKVTSSLQSRPASETHTSCFHECMAAGM